jgi:hypothetical protein
VLVHNRRSDKLPDGLPSVLIRNRRSDELCTRLVKMVCSLWPSDKISNGVN